MSNTAVVDRLARDATALVRVCTPADFRGGIVVVADRVGGRIAGLSIGNGSGVAELYRRRDARHAVVVDVGRVLDGTTTPTTDQCARVEALALHEVAHALFGRPVTVAETDTTLATAATHVETHTPATSADQHHVRWAAAFWLLAERAARFRQHGPRILDQVRQGVRMYGYAPADLERVCRGVDATVSLAELLAVDGPATVLLEAVLPGVDARMAATVAAGVVVAPRGVGHDAGTGLGRGL